MATRVTFIWEETGEMSYDSLMDQLMYLGAEDIETEEFDRPEPEPQTQRKKKSAK
ncbi:MAG TPA: hypothetical protein VNS88_04330 [Nitrospiraceae bacterium]|nr:hypothetical protein [Nitrospiraceae bacterium]